MTQEIINRLKELLAKATPGPWFYRPDQHDDWGWIRGGKKSAFGHPIVATAREGRLLDEDELAEHRRNKTDPAEPNARLIVEAINALPALLSTLTNLTPSGVEREPCRMCNGLGGVNEAQGEGVYVGLKCPQCFGFGSEEIVDLISDVLDNSMGPDWNTRLGAQHVADALSDAGLARAALSLPSEPPSQGDVEGRARDMLAAEYEADVEQHVANGHMNAAQNQRDKAHAIRAGVAELHAVRAISKALAVRSHLESHKP